MTLSTIVIGFGACTGLGEGMYELDVVDPFWPRGRGCTANE